MAIEARTLPQKLGRSLFTTGIYLGRPLCPGTSSPAKTVSLTGFRAQTPLREGSDALCSLPVVPYGVTLGAPWQATLQQTHPLYAQERAALTQLLTVVQPSDRHIAEAARLCIRFDGFEGHPDIHMDLRTLLNGWRLTRDQLNQRARRLWETGYRPQIEDDLSIGSGAA